MKELWVRANQDLAWDERKRLVTGALESGADAVLVKKGEIGKVKELGKINVAADDDDADIIIVHDIPDLKKIKNKESAFYKEIKNKGDEEEIAKAGKKADYVVVETSDWTVIPLENLIAELQGKAKIIVGVGTKKEAEVALQTLEVGVDGVLLNVTPGNAGEIKKIKECVEELSTEKLNLIPVKVTNIKHVGMGDRVCIDTCSMFDIGEGMLVGSAPALTLKGRVAT